MTPSNIHADELSLGQNVVIEPTAIIRGLRGNARRIEIGDNVYIGDSVQIICDEFSLGDYGRIQHHTNVHGYEPCRIGHNAWIGQYTIIDCIGGTTLGNNCGVGAHSQLWSHIKFGDTLEGCRFQSDKPLEIGNDVWFVGHCIVSPIVAADKAMAMVGSVVTKDMEYNQIYAGTPARSVSDKLGPQFSEVSLAEKYETMKRHLETSGCDPDRVRIVHGRDEFASDGRSYFAVETREYTKTGSDEEVRFMRYLLPDKAKFVPGE